MIDTRDKTYGELMVEAAAATGYQEVGETLEPILDRFQTIIEKAVQDNYDKGVRGRYYIHIWVTKEPYANNTLHIYPHCRRTRPSPYQGNDHYLWLVEDGGKVTFQWCIPKKEVVHYIMKNPNKFDANYVNMIRRYCSDKIETLDDYVVDGKIA